MILWTIQTTLWYERLKRRQAGVGSWDHVDDDYKRSYRWMTDQMKKRIGDPCINTPPLWAWYSFSPNRHKPDLRSSWLLPRGTHGVRIEFEADSSVVLLSDFEMWHAVLNEWYLARSLKDQQRWDSQKSRLSEEERRQQIIDSWDRIFEIRKGSHWLWGKIHERRIQACLWNIKESDIVAPTHFVAR